MTETAKSWDPKARYLVFVGQEYYPRGHKDFVSQESDDAVASDKIVNLLLSKAEYGDDDYREWGEIIDLQTGLVLRARKLCDEDYYVEWSGWKPIGQEDDND